MDSPPRSALPVSVAPDDTLLSLLLRSRSSSQPCRTGVTLLDLLHSGSGLQPGDVVELCGDAGCGKTAVLLHTIARVLSSTEPLHGGSLGSSLRGGARVALFSLDGRLSLPALALTVAAALAREEESQLGFAPAAAGAACLTSSPTARAARAPPGAPPPRPLSTRLRSALARVEVHSPASGVALAEALEALAASGAPLALLALDGMTAAWHWSCKLYGGAKAAEELHGRLAAALERIRQGSRCRVLWTRPTLYGKLHPALRSPAAQGPSPASALAAAALLGECTAEEAAGLGGLRRPTLSSSMPALTIPALVHASTLEAAAADTLGGALAAMVTHRVLLTRLRGAPQGSGAGAEEGGGGGGGAQPEWAALAAACPSAAAGLSVPVQLGRGYRHSHPSDPGWLRALDSSREGAGGSAEAVFHAVLVAARMCTGEGVKEAILALCA